jgi:hypothetical protein
MLGRYPVRGRDHRLRPVALDAAVARLPVRDRQRDMFSVFVRSSLIQLHTPDAMRGRVGAVSQLTISASNELGDAESGFLAALIGPVAAVVAGGVGAIAITLLWARLYPELRLAKTFDPPDVTAIQTQGDGSMRAGSILETIGHTAVIRINRLFGAAEVWVKSERANPGGSIKDRIALAMIEDAEQSGALQPAASSSSRPAAIPASASPWSRRSRATSSCWSCRRA